MKKLHFALAGLIIAGGLTACGSNETSSDSNTTTATTTTTDSSSSNASANSPNNTNATTASAATPLKKDDSMFVMKAAMGGMMEVEAGKLAQQNGQSDRVKAFGSMMEKDHSNANQELMSLASNHGVTVPSTLPPDMQKHIDMMKNMKGKEFDNHYMGMMLNDHKKDVGEFEKEANSGSDPDIKSWASKTLPTLKAHLDSAQAISKGKM